MSSVFAYEEVVVNAQGADLKPGEMICADVPYIVGHTCDGYYNRCVWV